MRWGVTYKAVHVDLHCPVTLKVCRIAAQERKSQTMATELVAGTS